VAQRFGTAAALLLRSVHAARLLAMATTNAAALADFLAPGQGAGWAAAAAAAAALALALARGGGARATGALDCLFFAPLSLAAAAVAGGATLHSGLGRFGSLGAFAARSSVFSLSGGAASAGVAAAEALAASGLACPLLADRAFALPPRALPAAAAAGAAMGALQMLCASFLGAAAAARAGNSGAGPDAWLYAPAAGAGLARSAAHLAVLASGLGGLSAALAAAGRRAGPDRARMASLAAAAAALAPLLAARHFPLPLRAAMPLPTPMLGIGPALALAAAARRRRGRSNAASPALFLAPAVAALAVGLVFQARRALALSAAGRGPYWLRPARARFALVPAFFPVGITASSERATATRMALLAALLALGAAAAAEAAMGGEEEAEALGADSPRECDATHSRGSARRGQAGGGTTPMQLRGMHSPPLSVRTGGSARQRQAEPHGDLIPPSPTAKRLAFSSPSKDDMAPAEAGDEHQDPQSPRIIASPHTEAATSGGGWAGRRRHEPERPRFE